MSAQTSSPLAVQCRPRLGHSAAKTRTPLSPSTTQWMPGSPSGSTRLTNPSDSFRRLSAATDLHSSSSSGADSSQRRLAPRLGTCCRCRFANPLARDARLRRRPSHRMATVVFRSLGLVDLEEPFRD
jgi:hypothetical protein